MSSRQLNATVLILTIFISSPASANWFTDWLKGLSGRATRAANAAKETAIATQSKASNAIESAQNTICDLSLRNVQKAVSGLGERMVNAAAEAQALVAAEVESAAQKTWTSLQEAGTGAVEIGNKLNAFVTQFPDSQVAQVVAGSSGGMVRLLAGKAVSLPGTAYRIWMFSPDADGLKKGIFAPATVLMHELITIEKGKAVMTDKEYARALTHQYGNLVFLVLEITAKLARTAPQLALQSAPKFALDFFMFKEKDPDTIDEVASEILRKFLKNAWKAIFSLRLSLVERFKLLTIEVGVLETGSEFALKIGAYDFVESLRAYARLNTAEIPESVLQEDLDASFRQQDPPSDQ